MCEELCLKRPYDSAVAHCVVDCTPVEGMALLLAMHEVASLWGQHLFVSRGDVPMQSHLSQLLLAGITRLSVTPLAPGESTQGQGRGNTASSFLYESGPRGGSLLAALSQGVSAYLDCAEPQCRLNGMRVACALSEATGHSLSFPE